MPHHQSPKSTLEDVIDAHGWHSPARAGTTATRLGARHVAEPEAVGLWRPQATRGLHMLRAQQLVVPSVRASRTVLAWARVPSRDAKVKINVQRSRRDVGWGADRKARPAPASTSNLLTTTNGEIGNMLLKPARFDMDSDRWRRDSGTSNHSARRLGLFSDTGQEK
ncbi:hypothetical protein K505DRAFT_59579 [Melanomma pulvis-pyrius CBS 109.77]|uniref:Uncharacterized protein n=1 Tax=Melanomma pulvis-pyrius CBS 109.77 TaxID=1314802 RepID=A0A6A6X6J4_9PLEO|nr:hypothetical protein K505DRAFT_59579 [Melanomma pulvis-pyrius CBS 109.77]